MTTRMKRVGPSIPTEILEEIFEWICVDGQPPSIRLALVCRRWKETILNLPTLWRTVEVDLKSELSMNTRLSRLKRRLKLAKDVRLDVIIKNSCVFYGDGPYPYSHLFHILLELAPIERWYSLWLEEAGFMSPHGEKNPLGEVFSGRFSSLRILSAVGCTHSALGPYPHSHLFQRIRDSNPPLQHLYLAMDWLKQELKLPTFTRLLRGLQSLTTYPGLLVKDQYETLPSFCEVGITLHCCFYQDFELSLPQIANIQEFTPIHLRQLDARNVVTLCISFLPYYDWLNESLDLPNLRTLKMRPCLPQHLHVFKAPKLEQLALLEPYQYFGALSLSPSRRELKSMIVPLFRRDRHLIVMNPTSLTIDLEGTAGRAFVVMLEAWPRLKHLSMTIGNDFDLFGLFARRLLDESSPICPTLETMLIETWWYAEGRQWRRWREVAKQLMAARKSGPLSTVIWRNKWFGAESVRQDEI